MVDKSSLYRKKSLFRVEICQKDAKILRGWFLANGKHIRLQAPIFARFWAPLRSFLFPISWIEHLNAWLPPNSRFFFFCCLDLEKRLLFLLSEALVLSFFSFIAICFLMRFGHLLIRPGISNYPELKLSSKFQGFSARYDFFKRNKLKVDIQNRTWGKSFNCWLSTLSLGKFLMVL